ncbi:MAG: patatin-like phospholipase family protein [Brasilonema angustatum HA4187-MV1]|jgi:predicted acylesterase/phospholipase RssA|nr:patatin-like phospholipase family protein [Brasilonema angustatum HA4187-MV1]
MKYLNYTLNYLKRNYRALSKLIFITLPILIFIKLPILTIEYFGYFIIILIKPFVDYLICLRVQLIIALAIYLIFTNLDQTIEVYQSLILDDKGQKASHYAYITTIFVSILTFFMWYTSYLIKINVYDVNTKNKNTSYSKETEKKENSETKFIQWFKKNIFYSNKFETDKKNKNIVLWIKEKIAFIQNQIKKAINFLEKPFVHVFNLLVLTLLGMIPIASLATGLYNGYKELYKASTDSSNVSNQDNYEKASVFLKSWSDGINVVLFLVLVSFVVANIIYLLKFKNKDWFSLKNPIFLQLEVLFFNLSHLTLNLFSLPLIADTSSKYSKGVKTLILVSVLLTIFSFYYEYEQKRKIEISTVEQNTYSKKYFIYFKNLIYLVLTVSLPFIFLNLNIPFSSSWIGMISVLSIGFTALLILFTTIYIWGHNTNIPLLTILFGLVIIFSLFNINDNHHLKNLPWMSKYSLHPLEDNFNTWLKKKPGIYKYNKDNPYTVYIVSAQGGGIYAAYYTARALAILSEKVPNFPQHLFAISSVSGGSLGASVYSSLIKETHGEYKGLSNKVNKYFNHDFLSPLYTFGMFPDMIQGFLPTGINDWDRAKGLEYAFEKAWSYKNSKNNNPFKNSFYEHWDPTKIAPALVFNTTVVETGKRLVISPFKQKDLDVLENVNLSLSTAIGLSARFPFITPVAWYHESKGKNKYTKHLVDGGYFDNSGIFTALDIGQTLDKSEKIKENNINFQIIYLAIGSQSENNTIDNQQGLTSFNEISSPLQAFINARLESDFTAIDMSKFIISSDSKIRSKDKSKPKVKTLILEAENNSIKLPLTWNISEKSKNDINKYIPDPSNCEDKNTKDFIRNNCSTFKSIKDDLIKNDDI